MSRPAHELARELLEASWGMGVSQAAEAVRTDPVAARLHDAAIAIVTRLLERGGSVPMAAAEDLVREAKAAQASFGEDHSLRERSWGRGVREGGSIPHSYGAEGRNWAGD